MRGEILSRSPKFRGGLGIILQSGRNRQLVRGQSQKSTFAKAKRSQITRNQDHGRGLVGLPAWPKSKH